jgi:hypothetical protein
MRLVKTSNIRQDQPWSYILVERTEMNPVQVGEVQVMESSEQEGLFDFHPFKDFPMDTLWPGIYAQWTRLHIKPPLAPLSIHGYIVFGFNNPINGNSKQSRDVMATYHMLQATVLCFTLIAGVPRDGVAKNITVGVHAATTTIFVVLATVGIGFTIICLFFNFHFREKK